MKCKSKQCTVFDADKLKLRLAEIEKEEQDPELYSDVSKMKALGIEKKSVLLILDKINATEKEINDLKVLYEMLSDSGSEDDWKDFDALNEIANQYNLKIKKVKFIYDDDERPLDQEITFGDI